MISGSGQERVSLDNVCDRLISEEISKKERGETFGVALNVDKGRMSQRGGNNRERAISKGRSKSRSKGKLECWNCGKKAKKKK